MAGSPTKATLRPSIGRLSANMALRPTTARVSTFWALKNFSSTSQTMRHDKLERELDLLLLLTENRHYDVETLCRRLAISRRMFYYYLESFRDWGFIVEKSGRCYSIDRESPYLKRLFETINFTEEEALTLLSILNKVGEENALAQRIRYKLNRFYDFHILDNPALRERVAHCVSVLYDAIKRKRVVKIMDYASPHSDTVSDRVVEPFLLLNDNNDVRCYELSSGENKTFKLSRMRDVVLLDLSISPCRPCRHARGRGSLRSPYRSSELSGHRPFRAWPL